MKDNSTEMKIVMEEKEHLVINNQRVTTLDAVKSEFNFKLWYDKHTNKGDWNRYVCITCLDTYFKLLMNTRPTMHCEIHSFEPKFMCF